MQIFGSFPNYKKLVGNTPKGERIVTGDFLSFDECSWEDFHFPSKTANL